MFFPVLKNFIPKILQSGCDCLMFITWAHKWSVTQWKVNFHEITGFYGFNLVNYSKLYNENL